MAPSLVFRHAQPDLAPALPVRYPPEAHSLTERPRVPPCARGVRSVARFSPASVFPDPGTPVMKQMVFVPRAFAFFNCLRDGLRSFALD